MPTIKPFKAIHPSPEIAGKVAVQVESLSIEEARSIRSENPFSYINMLVPRVDNPFGRGSKQELAFKKINENFDEFIDKKILVQDNSAAIYVYRTVHKELIQTGIWTLTSVDDYLNNSIRRHEHTREERERSLVDYLRQTGIDGNPVLITYPGNQAIDELIALTTSTSPVLRFENEGREHLLWQIGQAGIAQVISMFANLPRTYIADGHHRAAAACGYAIEQRKLNFRHTGNEEYNFFTSVYMSANQLRIIAFNRLIKDLGELTEAKFLERISARFQMQAASANELYAPLTPGKFSLYLNHRWYILIPLQQPVPGGNPVNELDVSTLQNQLFEPVLKISDPRNDPRLHFIGGATPVKELTERVDSGEFAAAFLLFPTSIEQLISVADAGEVMPPKSTWFEPKFQAGLLVHKID